jgi:hypothetical protein
VSPDGKWVAYFNESTKKTTLEVIPFEGGAPVFTFEALPRIPGLAKLHWTPDGKGLAYIANSKGVSNIWVQDLRGGRPTALTHFDTGLLFNFAWSRDGKKLALARGGISGDVVAITDAR